jgi:hypothetical protein
MRKDYHAARKRMEAALLQRLGAAPYSQPCRELEQAELIGTYQKQRP